MIRYLILRSCYDQSDLWIIYKTGKIHQVYRRRDHYYPFYFFISVYTEGVYPGPEGIACQINPLFPQIRQVIKCRLDIILFTTTLIIPAFTLTNPPEVESEGTVSLILIGPANSLHNIVIHIAAIQGMRVGHDNSPVAGQYFQKSLYSDFA